MDKRTGSPRPRGQTQAFALTPSSRVGLPTRRAVAAAGRKRTRLDQGRVIKPEAITPAWSPLLATPLARSRARAGAVLFDAGRRIGLRYCRLALGFEGVGLGRIVLVDGQQTARGRLIGRDRGEAETDVSLATKVSGARHARTTPMAANAKPAQAFHAKTGRVTFFSARPVDPVEPKFQARLIPAQRRRRCPG
jgi:hypothetical protein